MLSDSDSSDSDNGIRFKTASTRRTETFSLKSRNGQTNNHEMLLDRNRDRYANRSRDIDRRDDGSRRSLHNQHERKNRRSESRDRKRHNNHHSSDDRSSRHSTTVSRVTEDHHYKAEQKSRGERRHIRSRSHDKPVLSHSTERKRSKSGERSWDEKTRLEKLIKKSSSVSIPIEKVDEKLLKRSSTSSTTIEKNNKNSLQNSTLLSKISTEKINSPEGEVLLTKNSQKQKKHKRSKHGDDVNNDNDNPVKPNEAKVHLEDNHITTMDPSKSSPSKQSLSFSTKFIPSHTKNTKHSDQELLNVCGPSLPPHLQQNTSIDRDNHKQQQNKSMTTIKRIIGPAALPPPSSQPQAPAHHDLIMSDISESEDDCLIGPYPLDDENAVNKSEARLELEKRAIELKLAQFDEHERKNQTQSTDTREEWMLELPDVKPLADVGAALTARQFRTKERPDFSDRSAWTDTPADREHKAQHHRSGVAESVNDLRKSQQKAATAMYNAQRDAEQEAAARKHKSKKHKRDESLLEMHRKKLKKKNNINESTQSLARRPFSREADLKVNRFDQAQKNSILKKAQLLDTRFSSGETKYL